MCKLKGKFCDFFFFKSPPHFKLSSILCLSLILGWLLKSLYQRREENYVGKRVERMIVDGNRGQGRPKKRWKNFIIKDLREKNLTGDEVHNRAD
jgi:hypothetical protein